MKKIALISTFCDTEHKLQILKETILNVKKLGIDVMCLSPTTIPQDIVDLCDFFFFTKENPLLSWPVRMHTHWYEMRISENELTTLHRCFNDYGWAGLYQVKKLSQSALTFDYDIFYHMIYDLEFDDTVIRELKSNKTNIVHPRINPNHPDEIWETTLHFMIFDKEMMEKIEGEIILDEYLRTNGVAEGEVLKWTKKYNIHVSETPIKDRVFFWEDFEFFNYSKTDKFKFFISKNDYLDIWIGEDPTYKTTLGPSLRIVFYDLKVKNIILKINENTFEIEPKNWEIVEFPIPADKVKTIKLIFENQEIDFSDDYGKIIMNHIYYNYKK